MNINTINKAKKYLLSLFDDEDVFIEKDRFGEIVVRPGKEYNKQYTRSFCCEFHRQVNLSKLLNV